MARIDDLQRRLALYRKHYKQVDESETEMHMDRNRMLVLLLRLLSPASPQDAVAAIFFTRAALITMYGGVEEFKAALERVRAVSCGPRCGCVTTLMAADPLGAFDDEVKKALEEKQSSPSPGGIEEWPTEL